MKAQAHTILCAAVFTLAAWGARADEAPQPAVFARIGDQVITQADYDQAFTVAVRNKFYHGKAPQQELAALQRTVGQQLVDRVLLLQEVQARHLTPNRAAIDKIIDGYEQRYSASAQWKQNREKLLPPLVAKLEQDDLLAQLESGVRAVKPDATQAQAYYAANPAKFTEPEQLHVGVILLKVDPSSPVTVWKEIDAKAEALAQRARKGEDFAALAREYSQDGSREKGGDLGYVHAGMLADEALKALAPMQPGATSDSVRLLQGMGVFRLIDRKPARLLPFEKVSERAQQLAARAAGDAAWNDFLASLRKGHPAQLDTSRFLPLAEAEGGTKPH